MRNNTKSTLKLIPVLIALTFLLVPPMSSYATTIGSQQVIVPVDGVVTVGIKDVRIDSNDFFHVIYTNNTMLFYEKSEDQGSTWSTPFEVGLFVNGVTEQGQEILLNEDTGEIGIAFSSSPQTLSFRASVDDGDTWGATTFSSTTNISGFDGHFTNDGDNILFSYAGNSGNDLFTMVSTNFGTTWSSPQSVAGDSGVTLSGQDYPFGVVRDDDMYVAFFMNDSTTGNDGVYSVKSSNAGVSWDSPILLSSTINASYWNVKLFLSIDGTEVLVRWDDDVGKHYLSKSTNSGTSFASAVSIDENLCKTSQVTYAHGTNGADLVFACRELSGSGGLIYKYSDDFGDTFNSFATLNGTAGTTTVSYFPEFFMDGDNVFTLQEVEAGDDANEPIFLLSSDDAGQTFNADLIVGVNGSQTFKADTYQSGVTATDAKGDYWISAYRIDQYSIGFVWAFLTNLGLTPPDTTPPVVSLVGETPTNVNQFGVYTELGGTCLDAVDGQINGSVVISGDVVDEDVVGTYTVDYDCDDTSSNSAITIQMVVNILDVTMPMISPNSAEPITVYEDSMFIPNEFVSCSDAVDGDLTSTMNPEVQVDTSTRGTQTQDYFCIDTATNSVNETISFIVKKVSTGGSSGSSSSTSSGTQSTNDIPKLSDIPVLSFSDSPSQTTTTEGQSISDLFANLFDNRITEGITTPVQSQGSSPLGGSSETTQRPNPITDFLQNLFANFFN